VRIAFVSYEYPPDTGYGGIATYVRQAAAMLRRRGHDVEVFAGSERRSASGLEDGILVHRVRAGYAESPPHLGTRFARRHAEAPFDVLEGPELDAEARDAVRLVPDIPFVVRLHSWTLLLWEGNTLRYEAPPWRRRLALALAGRLRGFAPYWSANGQASGVPAELRRQDELERAHALAADEVCAPSVALRERAARDWRLDEQRLSVVPYPFTPPPALLAIPAETHTGVVTFVGRLEVNKGVLDLALALPAVLERHPGAAFRLVGDTFAADGIGDTRRYLERFLLRRWRRSVEFTGFVGREELPALLAATDVCTFPSFWDNFPNVCLEAMAAARGIVGTASGGMADMLDGGSVGRLVPPRAPERLAEAIADLLADPELRIELGRAARERLLAEYADERIGALQEEVYRRAIARRRSLGPRRLYASTPEPLAQGVPAS
jgi:glycogen(starch) synthase